MKVLRSTALVGLMTTASIFTQGCADLVIKVNKKGKSGSDLASAQQELNGNEMDAESYLDDMDNLKKVAIKMLIDELSGKDFRKELRSSVRNYRKLLIQRATGPLAYKELSFANDNICRDGKLNLSLENEYLGIILKTALLGKLGEESARALNVNIADSAGAIAQLVMMEIGLEVDGDSSVSRTDDVVTTEGDFSIRLLPFEGDSAADKAADAVEVLHLKFKRVADQDNVGTFAAEISLDYAAAEKQVETIVLKLNADRARTDSLWTHNTSMELGLDGKSPRMTRSLSVKELGDKKYEVTEKAKVEGHAAVDSKNLIDLNNIAECKTNVLPEADDGNGKGSDGGEDPFENEDKDPVQPGNPNQNPNQSPSQSPAQK